MGGVDPRMLMQLMGGASEEDLAQVLEELDTDALIEEAIPQIEQKLQPHFEDIRENGQQADAVAVREMCEAKNEAQQQQVFDATAAEIAGILRECRESPSTGFPKLKAIVRDPEFIEPLLLIFDEEDHIDPDYSDDLKEFSVGYVQWVTCQVIPEIYTDDERRAIAQRMQGSE